MSKERDLLEIIALYTSSMYYRPPVYGRGFLPGTYERTVFRNAGSPILYLNPSEGTTDQRGVLDLAQSMNREHLTARGEDVD